MSRKFAAENSQQKIRSRKFADNVKAIGSVEPNSRMIVYDTPTKPPARRGTSSPNTGAYPEARLSEIPQWIFESGACRQVGGAAKPAVDCAALLDLQLLLHHARPLLVTLCYKLSIVGPEIVIDSL
jgi:hypothetical protein